MNIAVLIYGRLNFAGKHYKNIIESLGNEHTIHFYASSDNSSNLDEFIREYCPIAYINDSIEYTCDLSKYEKDFDTNPHNMSCHFINKKRVFALFEKHKQINYDVVVSLRIDLVFEHNFKFIFTNIEHNTIYVPDVIEPEKWLNDQVAYGDISTMQKYMNIWENIIPILENKHSIVHPESLTYAYIKYNKVNIHRFQVKYFIQR